MIDNTMKEEADEYDDFVKTKIMYFSNIMYKNLTYTSTMKHNDIIGISDQLDISNKYRQITTMMKNISNNKQSNASRISILQTINNEFSDVFRKYGTRDLGDLIEICFGNSKEYVKTTDEKLDLIYNFFHPTSYVVMERKDLKQKCDQHKIDVNTNINSTFQVFQMIDTKKHILQIFGARVVIKHLTSDKYLLVNGFVDNIDLSNISNSFITSKLVSLQTKEINLNKEENRRFDKYLTMCTCRDFILLSEAELIEKYTSIIAHLHVIKQKGLQTIVKEFMSYDISEKRNILLTLMLSESHEMQYLTNLLYDLISNGDNNGNLECVEQFKVFDTFPNSIKEVFIDCKKTGVEYINEFNTYDTSKIPIEQQIYLMHADNATKEKAMVKLKELKAKPDDSAMKARQYLEGLLKIPFGIVRKEAMLQKQNNLKNIFYNWKKETENSDNIKIYSNVEMYTCINKAFHELLSEEFLTNFVKSFDAIDKKCITKIYNAIFKSNQNLTKKNMSQSLKDYINKKLLYITPVELISEFAPHCELILGKHNSKDFKQLTALLDINQTQNQITSYLCNIENTLNSCVHGHDNAKRHVNRIIGQWIHGENSKGYCIGFEGPPGVGKTTLAKNGLSNLLKDDSGTERPFAMIQLGGDSNGATLHGHNYTYVGSTWGSIVQILMDKQCMNPIILIDEVDKISKTEQGRELIGILTHMLDATQNDCFQDKYFGGVNIDLSNVLFILSYNDPNSIDKVLLDRIHRIKFSALSLDEKIYITEMFIIPDYKKMFGLDNAFCFEEGVLRTLIEDYTSEPGIRKLKELLYIIIGEVNLQVINDSSQVIFPIKISLKNLHNKYLKDKHPIRHQLIHTKDRVGAINCLFATDSGYAGILSATSQFIHSEKMYDLKLTGLLDEMMKESFQISFTVACNKLSEECKTALVEKHLNSKTTGIHMHMGDGSVNKSGTSAGIAITILFYSLLSGHEIKHNFAVTGEAADLNGTVGEIGALKYKFIGGIKAGVKHFIFPQSNMNDFNDFMEKYENTEMLEGISFHPVNNIDEALELIIV